MKLSALIFLLPLPLLATTYVVVNNASLPGGLVGGDVVAFHGIRSNAVTLVSGSLGNPITYTSTNFAGKWSAGTWVGGNNGINEPVNGLDLHDIVIDGLWIEATNNGYGKVYNNNFIGIDITTYGAVEIKNCVITNLTYRTSANYENDAASCQGIVIGGTMTNVLIHNNWIEMVGNAIIVGTTAGYCTNIQVYSNRLERCSWGYGMNVGATSYCVGVQVWANRINNQNAWDTPNGFSSTLHQDGIYPNINNDAEYLISRAGDLGLRTNLIYGAGGKTNVPAIVGAQYNYNNSFNVNDVGLFIGNNPVDPNWTNNIFGITLGQTNVTTPSAVICQTNIMTLYGTPGAPVRASLNRIYGGTNYGMKIYRNYIGPNIGVTMSGAIFIAPNYRQGQLNAQIYNNYITIGTGNGLFNGAVNATSGSLIANNTLINSNFSGQAIIPNGDHITNINNLVVGFNNIASFANSTYGVPGGTPLGLDYSNTNIYFGLTEWAAGQGAWPLLQQTSWDFAYYVNPPFETGSYTNNPNINTDGSVPTNSIAALSGFNLTSLGITSDFYGNSRSASGAWSIGAFEATNSVSPPTSTINIYAPVRYY